MKHCDLCGKIELDDNDDHQCFTYITGETEDERLLRYNKFLYEKLVAMHRKALDKWVKGSH